MEKIIERLQTFVNQKGGAVEVAEKLGKHPNKFYVMFRGETKPNSTTIHELKMTYPDLDLNWLYTGVESSKQGLVSFPLPKSEVEKENQKLKEQLEEAKQTIEELKGDKKSYMKIISNIPDETMRSFSGVTDEAEGKMIALDVEWHDRKIIGFEINKNRA